MFRDSVIVIVTLLFVELRGHQQVFLSYSVWRIKRDRPRFWPKSFLHNYVPNTVFRLVRQQLHVPSPLPHTWPLHCHMFWWCHWLLQQLKMATRSAFLGSGCWCVHHCSTRLGAVMPSYWNDRDHYAIRLGNSLKVPTWTYKIWCMENILKEL